ncbi:hypothetical protein VSU19_13670 [Verrucomicrobiales bacterium BCK34]|nr:hypothetical protein [Verrucomicrobiales bacterium BCK34]
MIDHTVNQLREGRFRLFLLLCGALAMSQPGRAEEALPFAPSQICRYSVDNIPRSIAIRQGAGIWFGYDLEKALVFKVWKSPENKPGVIVKSFKAQSSGAALFEGETSEGWQIARGGKSLPLTARYLGCTQHKENFELRWELRYPDGTINMSERIAVTPATAGAPPTRELRVESLPEGASLALPAAYFEAWELTGPDRKPVKTFTAAAWHQLSLR